MSKKILLLSSPFFYGALALCLAAELGCSDDTSGNGGASSSASAGSSGSSASSAAGGSSSSAVASSSSAGGGGSSAVASSSASGGKSSAGGSSSVTTTSSGGKSTATTSVGGSSGGTDTTTGGTAVGGAGGTSKTGGTTGGKGGTTKTGGSEAGGTATGGTAAGGTGGSTSTGPAGDAKPSEGCGKDPPTLKSATVGQATPVNTISGSRQFLVRWPTNYDNKKAYPLHIGLHGYNGDLAENGRDNFGLWDLSKGSVIFVTLSGVNKAWEGPRDLTYANAVIKQVESELCIDTSKIILEGFSMGAAMSWYLTCSSPNVYRAVVGHSGGGVDSTSLTCSPVAYWGSLGTGESGNSQKTQTDRFATANGCTIETLPTASTGKHVCTPYKGCKEGFPVTWCSYDGQHGFTDTDSGSSKYWVPQAVWDFLSPLLQ